MDDEVWRPVVEFPEHYEVSNHGRVRRAAGGRGSRPGRIRVPVTNPVNGYQAVVLSVARHRLGRSIHRMVAQAFLEDDRGGEALQVNHRDGNRTNNHVGNLEWVTSQENSL